MNAFLAVALLAWTWGGPAMRDPAPPERPRITFILGSDEDAARPMYQLAFEHFRTDPLEATPTVIGGLRSLKEVVDYLAGQSPAGGRPWGVINLVVHANAQGTLEVPLEPGGPNVTEESLGAALARGVFTPLTADRLDARSEVRLHGCALGRNAPMLRLLSQAFAGRTPQRPLIRASKWLTCFRSRTPEAPGAPTRVLCESWDVVFRPSAPPTPELLARRFKDRFPEADLDPGEALARQASRWLGDPFSYEAPLKFSWTVAFPAARQLPEAPAQGRLRHWLLAQEGFQRNLQGAGLRFSDLDWSVTPTWAPIGTSTLPSLRVEGRGRAVHILRALRSPVGPGQIPPHLAWEDTRFYASAR